MPDATPSSRAVSKATASPSPAKGLFSASPTGDETQNAAMPTSAAGARNPTRRAKAKSSTAAAVKVTNVIQRKARSGREGSSACASVGIRMR